MHEHTTRGTKNYLDSWLFKGCSPFQSLCNLTGNRPQSATIHTANRVNTHFKNDITNNKKYERDNLPQL